MERYLNSRWRLAFVAAAAGSLFWAARLVTQFVSLPSENGIRAVFSEYMRGASDLAAGADPYGPYLAQFSRCYCRQIDGYIYPPPFAEALRLLLPFPINTAARIWLLFNVACLAATCWIVYRIIAPWVSRGALALLIAAFAFFLPLYQALYYLEVSVLMTFFLAIAARYFVANEEDRRTGVALGAGVVLKLQPAVMLPMLVRSRRELGRPLAATVMAGTVALGLAASWLMTDRMGEYMTTVVPQLMGGTTIPENFSLPAWLARAAVLATGGRPAWVGMLTSVPNLVVVGLTWRMSWGIDHPRGRAAVFAAFLATIPIVSSISWDHHLAVLLLVYALIAPWLRIGSAPWWLTLASYPLVSLTTNLTRPLMQSAGLAHPAGGQVIAALAITGINLLGMVFLWGACLLCLRAAHEAEQGVPEARWPVTAAVVTDR